ncbi:MAG: Crp/Fnr family transcriptional regulator [Muribaculaceae bacterium]|nr:Crp/Fnr family transcriptional regulator [Muribaculaceae bacterium]
MDLKKALRMVHPISDDAIEELKALLVPFNVEKGGQLIAQGVVARDLFIILEGSLRCYTLVDGIEYTRWFATPGDVVTSMFSYCHNLPASSTIAALSNAHGYSIRIEDVKRLISTNSEWAQWSIKYIMEGLFILERRQTLLGYGDAQSRYLNFLRARSVETVNNIPLQYIASYLGMTPQTLSRVRRRIARDPNLCNGEEFPETDL